MTANDVTKKMAAGFYRDIEFNRQQHRTRFSSKKRKKLNELEGIKGTGSDYLNTILEMHVDFFPLDDFI